MRNSAAFWEKTARVGELCWCRERGSGYRYSVGIVVDIKGDATAAQIRQQFGEAATKLRSKDRELVWTVAEFGFGMNPNARMSGHVLEDEKRLGTCYFSIGDNSSLGGNASVGIHVPGVLISPSLWLDDTQIIDNGKFVA